MSFHSKFPFLAPEFEPNKTLLYRKDFPQLHFLDIFLLFCTYFLKFFCVYSFRIWTRTSLVSRPPHWVGTSFVQPNCSVLLHNRLQASIWQHFLCLCPTLREGTRMMQEKQQRWRESADYAFRKTAGLSASTATRISFRQKDLSHIKAKCKNHVKNVLPAF